ncbi:MAG TPA: tetratricopeptide repeat protein [Phycisphaerae bacterium]|nr:tetratricopeptide repeat protein [Phycisphaerae bacterium]HRY71337.1 tetratricopeptide repeat protein [Phycisphaerae bacterium]HSA29790.1 tetratricopeptide repeat protein [Phycisphaerae bacterium]
MATLLYLLFGLGAIIAGPCLVFLALFGRVPFFVGPTAALGEAVTTYWKGRLACLVFGPILFIVGCMLIREPFSRSAYEKYKEAYEQALQLGDRQDYAGALKALDRALKYAEWPAVVHATRGSVLKEKGDLDGAHQALAEALKLDPTFSWAHALQGQIYYLQDKPAAARASADQAIQQADPRLGDLLTSQRAKLQYAGISTGLYLRGFLDTDEKQYKKAIEDFSGCLRRDTSNLHAAAQYSMAYAYRALRQYDPAVEAARKAIEMKPNDGQGHYQLGMALGAKGKWSEARASFDQYIRLSPDRAAASNRLAWDLATAANPDCRQPKMAVECAETLVRESKRQVHSYLDTLAAAYARAGRFGDAVKTQKEAIKAGDEQEYRERLRLYEQNTAYTADK